MAELLRLQDPPVEVSIRRSARARRLTLTVPQTGGPPRVTAPSFATERDIRLFLSRQSAWLSRALARMRPMVEVDVGARLPVAGAVVEVVATTGPRRPPALVGERLVLQGGAPGGAARRIEAWLKELARARLTAVAGDCAGRLGAQIGAISLRDPKTRWGSCNSRGDLSFSWRLAMAPAEVLDYVAAHEAAHLLEMNHGPRFWALVDRLRPGWREQRDWLRRSGAGLHAFRFSPVAELQ